VLVVPGHTEILPNQTDVRVRLASSIKLFFPILKAAMDAVTGAHLVISLAQEGGLGIIYRNKSPQDQAGEVDKVNRLQSGMIVEQMTLPPVASLRQRDSLLIAFG
jgi:IMP dehydrogenase